MKIWSENFSDNDLYHAILHNQQINIDIGDEIDNDIYPVIINVYNKTNNNFISNYKHALTIPQILSYIFSYLRFNQLYDFEVIRLDEIDDEIHREQSIELLNEALREYTIIKNTMAEAFDTEENKMILHKTNVVIHTLQDKINEINVINNN
jgi:hypothetical protein